jgi:hypothetical protein
MNYPEVTRRLLAKLSVIPHTTFPYDFMPYLPASAILKNGKDEARVVFFGEHAYQKIWGPASDRRMIDVRDVAEVSQSESQLLPEFANQLYQGGENSMGGTYFSLSMKDGKLYYYQLGGILDFVAYPVGYGMHDVSSVKKGIPWQTKLEVKDRIPPVPDYAWCLFEEPSDIAKRVKIESPKL